MSNVFENKGALATTIVVAASNSLNKGQANYVCDGVQDNVEIQAALTAGAGGKVLLLEGTYNCIANLLVPANTTLEGQGLGTILNFTGAAITNAITVNGNNVHIKNLKAQLAAGAGAGGSRPNIVYANTKTLIWLENLWLVGDTTVADDGSYDRQNSIYFYSVSESFIIACRAEDNVRCGIRLRASTWNIIEGNICQGNTKVGIYIYSSQYNNVTGNGCFGNNIGINLDTSAWYNTIVGNTCQGNIGVGININNSSWNVIIGNSVQANNEGICLQTSEANSIVGNTLLGNTSTSGALSILSASNYNTITGNTLAKNRGPGIYINSSHHNTVSGNTCVENSQEATNTYDDIYLLSADYNNIQGNTCRAGVFANKSRYGINISNVGCDKNLVANNDLYNDGFGTGSFNDAGTLTHVEDNNRGITINQIKMFRFTKNTSGAQRVAGDVVSLKAVAAGNEVTAPAAVGERQVYGMVAETINDAASGLVQVKGKTTVLKGTNAGGGDIAIGDNLITENGVRARKAAAATDPIFARALEALAAADGVIDAYILSPWD